MVEVELPTPEEKAELIASLEEGERDIAEGRYTVYSKGMFLREFLEFKKNI